MKLVHLATFYDIADTELDSQKATYERVVQYLKKYDYGIYGVRKSFHPLRVSGVRQQPLLLGARDSYEQFVDDPKTRRFDATKGRVVMATGGARGMEKVTSPNVGGTYQQSQVTKRVQLIKNFNLGKFFGFWGEIGFVRVQVGA